MAEIVKKRVPFERPNPSGSIIESEVFDASRQARQILVDAQAKAEQIVYDAQSKAHQTLETARQKGRDEGQREGLEKFTQNILRLNREYDELLSQAETQLLELAVGVARKIIHAELKAHPGVMVDIVRKAIAPMNRKRNITIRLHPEDRRLLEARKADLLETMTFGGNILFVSDIHVATGGCIVETEHGSIDARLDTQLAKIHEILTGEIVHFEHVAPETVPPSPPQEDPVMEAPVIEKPNAEEPIVTEAAPEVFADDEAEITMENFQEDFEDLTKALQDNASIDDLLKDLDDLPDEIPTEDFEEEP